MKQTYIEKRFNASSLVTLKAIEEIADDYEAQGYTMTVRQLYYQLVASGVIANNLKEYKRICNLINDAKLAGLLDWDTFVDRTREFERVGRWTSGGQILRAVAQQFHKDHWVEQDHRVFVIVEKEALVGVLSGVCREFDMPLLAARGYPSGTVLREFAESDILPAIENNQYVEIIHLGDHDPSGIDMTRDIEERLSLFSDDGDVGFGRVTVHRIALNMPQIEELRPPENPAKMTDTRVHSYIKKFGRKSWELDALTPRYINDLVRKKVAEFIDTDLWETKAEEIHRVKLKLEGIANAFVD